MINRVWVYIEMILTILVGSTIIYFLDKNYFFHTFQDGPRQGYIYLPIFNSQYLTLFIWLFVVAVIISCVNGIKKLQKEIWTVSIILFDVFTKLFAAGVTILFITQPDLISYTLREAIATNFYTAINNYTSTEIVARQFRTLFIILSFVIGLLTTVYIWIVVRKKRIHVVNSIQ